jgi:hypothetical protein
MSLGGVAFAFEKDDELLEQVWKDEEKSSATMEG